MTESEGKDSTAKRKDSPGRMFVRVLKTLAIWLALAVVAEVVITIVPNVRPCMQSGPEGCWAKITATEVAGSPWNDPRWPEWTILAIALVVAVRIMYPPDDGSLPVENQAGRAASSGGQSKTTS